MELWGMMKIMSAGLLSAVVSVTAAAAAHASSDVVGVWRMANGKVTVRLAPCGGKLCGTVIGLKRPLDKNGKPKLDKENPDAALRKRPVIGLTILSNMTANGEGRWSGTIYNPDDGNTYKSKMRLQSADTIKVEGCVVVFCKSMKFVRVK
jgi:uncharacterized protein (DUF2147 family)